MFDGLRTECKGAKGCAGIRCADCPLYGKVCNTADTTMFMFHAHETIEIVENWAKEHPIKTNADKFREVFGFEPLPNYSTLCADANIKCEECQYFDGSVCVVSDRFWNTEYEEKTKGCEE